MPEKQALHTEQPQSATPSGGDDHSISSSTDQDFSQGEDEIYRLEEGLGCISKSKSLDSSGCFSCGDLTAATFDMMESSFQGLDRSSSQLNQEGRKSNIDVNQDLIEELFEYEFSNWQICAMACCCVLFLIMVMVVMFVRFAPEEPSMDYTLDDDVWVRSRQLFEYTAITSGKSFV